MDQRKRTRLTRYSTKAGWASEFVPGDLEQASKRFEAGRVSGAIIGKVVGGGGVRVTR